MEIYSELLTLWLKFYYRSCLSRQIFSFISFFFPFTYRSHIFSTSFVLLRLFVQIILSPPHPPSIAAILPQGSTTSFSHYYYFLFKETTRKYITGEREKGEGRISPRYQETAGLFLMKPCLHSCTFVNHSQMFFCHHLITMCTFTEGRGSQTSKGHSNGYGTGEHTPVMTASSSTQTLRTYEYKKKNDYSLLNISIKVWNTHNRES